MARQELIERIMWSGGGYGFGVGRVGAMMVWDSMEPDAKHPDWPSIVTVHGPPEKYSDDEIEALADFSAIATADYDELFTVRMGANLIVFDKPEWRQDGLWMRKRLTWESGPMWSSTLADAISVMADGLKCRLDRRPALAQQP